MTLETSESNLISSKNLISSWVENLKRIENSINWVRCPACREEWTKLRVCDYFRKTTGKKFIPENTSLCVECAESLKSFDWIVKSWPQKEFDNWPNPRIEKKWIQSFPSYVWFHKGKPDAEKVYLWKNIMVKLWLCDLSTEEPEYLLKTNPDGKIVIYIAGKDEPIIASNAVDAWFSIRNEL